MYISSNFLSYRYATKKPAPHREEGELEEVQWADDRMEMRRTEDTHPKATDVAPSGHEVPADSHKREDCERQVLHTGVHSSTNIHVPSLCLFSRHPELNLS